LGLFSVFGGIVGFISGFFVLFKSCNISKSNKTKEEKMKSFILNFMLGIIIFIFLSILLFIILILTFMTPVGFTILYNPLFHLSIFIIGLISGLFTLFKMYKILKSNKENKLILFVLVDGITLFLVLLILLIIISIPLTLILMFQTPTI